MADNTQVLLFGDLSNDFVSELRGLFSVKDNPILKEFFEQAHYVVRAQMIEVLPPHEHKASRTADLPQMLQKYVEGKLSPAFQVVLSCIAQLGSCMREYQGATKPFPQPANSYVLGLSIGSLSAAAVSCSSSISDLLPMAVQTVLIAFRLGLCITDMRDRLEVSARSHEPWAIEVSGIDFQATNSAIRKFCGTNVLPKTRQPWITTSATESTTVSGPPQVLDRLLEAPEFAEVKARRIPVYVPLHNSQIFTIEDVKSILSTTSEEHWTQYSTKIPFFSHVTGRLAWHGNYWALIELALSQCLVDIVGRDKILKEVPRLLHSRNASHIVVTSFNASCQEELSTALGSSGATVIIEESTGKSKPFSHRPGSEKCKLAIVSMSGRFPEAQNTDAFWDLLYKGTDTCKEVPRIRWDVATHVDASGKAHNKGATPWGCWLDYAAEFDPRFFSISPKEAMQMDPAQRMVIMSTFEAMERAGIVPDTTPSAQRNRIGVFMGVTTNDWMEANTSQNVDTYFITGGNRGFIPGRINFAFEFSGPSYVVDTACASSLAAIEMACNSLWMGDCDTAVAGGTNMIFMPDGHTGLDKGFFLSRTGNCKSFADNADGYCRAEGVGTVFIKRLEDALADRDPILATILDTKTNHSSMSHSITRPHAPAQIDNMSAILSAANVDFKSLSYVEMHATGTQVGDAVEMESVLSVFAPNEQARDKDHPLYLGSAKANIGHGEGVSGVTSLIKVLLMMQHNIIPPHCGIKPDSKINHNYPDLGARNVHIALEPKPWPRTQGGRRALVNNFSAAGGNTALLIEDAPKLSVSSELDPRTCHIVNMSAAAGKSLKANLESLLAKLQHQDLCLGQLSYTTTARRYHLLHRVSVIGSSVDEIKSKLETAIKNGEGINRPKSKPQIIFAFTGQGSQYLGMGKQLYQAYPKFRSDLQRFNQLAETHGFPSFLHVYTIGNADIEQFLPVVVQLAITCLQMALGSLMRSFGVKPSAVIGHSLGEYAALHTAGVLSASDTIYLVGKRAQLLQDCCQRGTHAMLATRASAETVSSLISATKCEVACVNGPEDTVISGSVEEIANAHRIIMARGIKCTLLRLPFAFHSAQVEPILDDFEDLASGASFEKPEMPILSPLLGNAVEDAGIVTPSYLTRHCRDTVDMVKILQFAKAKAIVNDKTIVIEIGPKPLISGMLKNTVGPQMTVLPTLTQNGDVWPNLLQIFSTLYTRGLDLDWVAYHAPFDAAKRVIDLPSYNWDLKEYFIPYEGDWCLHRHHNKCDCADAGKAVQTTEYEAWSKRNHEHVLDSLMPLDVVEPAKPSKPSKQDATKEAYPEIMLTTTLHRVIELKTEPLGSTFTVETDMSRKDVNDIARGHLMDGLPLCTPSFYADIAMQMGKYCMDRIRAGHAGAIDGLVEVCDLVVDRALIPHGEAPQLLRSTLTITWPPKAAATARSAKVKFATYFDDGKLDTEHAACTVRFTTDSQLKSLRKKVPEYQSHIRRLREGIMRGKHVRYSTKSGYKLMSSMAEFHPDYKRLDNVILNEVDDEATCTMDFTTASGAGTYAAHPAFVDAIIQLSGFTMNAKDDTDVDKEVFVNHGWDSFQLYQPLVKNKSYVVYTKMGKGKTADLVHGDVIVLDGDEVVAFVRGLSLRNVARRVLTKIFQMTLDKGVRKRGGKPSASTAAKTSSVSVSSKVMAPAKIPKAFAMPPTAVTVASTSALAPAKIATTPVIAPKHVSASPVPGPVPVETQGLKDETINAVLRVISEESGIAIEDLTDDTNFLDIGVDSLSSMVIGSRLREDLGMDLDPDFSIFTDCPDVASLRSFLGSSPDPTAQVPAIETSVGGKAKVEQPILEQLAVQQPAIQQPVIQHSAAPTSVPAANIESMPSEAMNETMEACLKIIAEESGVAAEDLTGDTVFIDIGIDSLCSMVISSRLREELELDLDAGFSLFVEWPTVSDMVHFFGGDRGGRSSEDSSETRNVGSGKSSQDGLDTPSSSSSVDVTSFESDQKPGLNLVPYCRPSNSVILQGRPKFAKRILFMLPDGGGSASSYAAIPRLKSDVALVGINCPYARDPENMNCTHGAMIESFCQEIRRRQPKGPYHLGGWSSGAAFAYVTAEALVIQGEEVHSLIVIDAPVPQEMEKLPVEFYDYCNSSGLFADQPGGASEPPPYLVPHFVAVTDVMLDYEVAPLKTNRMPKVGIVWASDTVMDEATAPKMKGMHFMIQKRTNFGPDGWDTVVPGGQFDIVKADGANHFTLMSKQYAPLVSKLIDRVVGNLLL